MDGNQSDIALTDITEAEHLGANDVANDHENGAQVNDDDNAYGVCRARVATHIYLYTLHTHSDETEQLKNIKKKKNKMKIIIFR